MSQTPPKPAGIPAFLDPLGRAWARTSPRLIPVFAVITAFAVGVVLMIITAGEGDVGEGLRVSREAYAALIEGASGLAINKVAEPSDFEVLQSYVAVQDIESERISRVANPIKNVTAIGPGHLREHEAFLEEYPDLAALPAEEFSNVARRKNFIRDVLKDPQLLRDALPTLQALEADEVERGAIDEIATLADNKTGWSAEEQAQAAALWPAIATMDGDTLRETIAHFDLIHDYQYVTLQRTAEVLALLDAQSIEVFSGEAESISNIAVAGCQDPNNCETGLQNVLEGIQTLAELDAVGIEENEVRALSDQMSRFKNLYDAGYLQNPSVQASLQQELPAFTAENLAIMRPGTLLPVVVHEGQRDRLVGRVEEGRSPIVYLRLGNQALLFVPAQLESTLVRAIPFIIAGLAVGLGFKAGVFNIGAEGQVLMGAVFAVSIGIWGPLQDLPLPFYLPMVIICGLFGGFLWGALPGLLKAYTGAHEVITTIMLNFVAARLIDWLIKSDNPILLGNPDSSVPKTPLIAQNAQLVQFHEISIPLIVGVGVVVAGLWIALKIWNEQTLSPSTLQRPLLWGAGIIIMGVFLKAISVRHELGGGSVLHIGIVLMFIAVLVTDWFLSRTTAGFELRTVGTNASAARYAGMSVNWNIILAMALSGMLAGYAGMIEISGKEFGMQPGLLAGVGFDAIAVALLARTNPRGMIWAGILWGGLLSGAGLMQARAEISSDLVRIIQGLIIMFVSADQIIRFLWRVPKPSKDEQFTLNTSWGGK
jgi:simple sugar transport system permease protein